MVTDESVQVGLTTYRLRGDRLTVDGVRTQTHALADLAWVLMPKAALPSPLTPAQAAGLVAHGRIPPEVVSSGRLTAPTTLLLGVHPSGTALQLEPAALTTVAQPFRDHLAQAIAAVPAPDQPSRPAAIARLAGRPTLSGWMLRHLTWAPAPLARVCLVLFGVLALVFVPLGIVKAAAVPGSSGPLLGGLFCLAVAALCGLRAFWVRRRELAAGNWPFAVLAARHERPGSGAAA